MTRELRIWGTRDERTILEIRSHAPTQPCDLERVQDLALQIAPATNEATATAKLKDLGSLWEDVRAANDNLEQTKARVAKFTEATQKKHIKPAVARLEIAKALYGNALNVAAKVRSEPARRANLARQLAIVVGNLDADWSVTSSRISGVVRLPSGDGQGVRLALRISVDPYDDLSYIRVGPIPSDCPEGMTDAQVAQILHAHTLHEFVTLRRTEKPRDRELAWGFDLQAFGLTVADMPALKATIDLTAGWVTALYDAKITSGFFSFLMAEDEVAEIIGDSQRNHLSNFRSRINPQIDDGE